jgi:hypothetical protein
MYMPRFNADVQKQKPTKGATTMSSAATTKARTAIDSKKPNTNLRR